MEYRAQEKIWEKCKKCHRPFKKGKDKEICPVCIMEEEDE